MITFKIIKIVFKLALYGVVLVVAIVGWTFVSVYNKEKTDGARPERAALTAGLHTYEKVKGWVDFGNDWKEQNL